LTFRLYISKKMGGNNEFFENFERNKYLKKLPSTQRVKYAWRNRVANQLNQTVV